MTNFKHMFLDMFYKRKTIFCFGFFILIIFWFIEIQSKGMNSFQIYLAETIMFIESLNFFLDASQYQALKQTLEHTKQQV